MQTWRLMKSLPIKAASIMWTVALCVANLAEAQTIRGRLIDPDGFQPIAGATVSIFIVDEDGSASDASVASVLSNDDGDFLLNAPEEGRYIIRSSRIGYEPIHSRVIYLSAHTELVVELRMSVEAIAIAPVVVLGERGAVIHPALVREGFYERRREFGGRGLPFSQFFTSDELQLEHSHYLSDVFRWIPAARIVGEGAGAGARIQLKTGCHPTFYIDGIPIRARSQVPLNEVVRTTTIVGVEIYPGFDGPFEYRDLEPGPRPCGSVVMWTDAGVHPSTRN